MQTAERKCRRCGAGLGGTGQANCPNCPFQLAAGLGTAARTIAPAFSPPDPARLAALMTDFEIHETIGRGGMGAVYRVTQKRLNRVAALKVLPPERANDPAFVERFFREAQALGQLSHPHIVDVYDMGQQGPYLYILMEYVEGVPLREAIRQKSLEPKDALRLTTQLCNALEAARGRGIVHRDIKPDNVLVTVDGSVKLLDFGLVKLTHDSRLDRYTLTEVNVRMGTPHYMAPEQMNSAAAIDHRVDVYSLGVLLYEMLAGELPVLDYTPPSRKTNVDPRVDRIVHRAIRESAAERYASAREMGEEIDYILRTPRRRATITAAGAALALVGAIAGIGWYRGTTADPAPPPGTPISGLPIAVVPFDAGTARDHQERWAAHVGVPVEWTNSIGMRFSLIPPGEYLRGMPPEDVERYRPAPVSQGGEISGVQIFESNLPQHRVRLTEPFYLSVTETTQGQYRRVMDKPVGFYHANGPGKHLLTTENPDDIPVQTLAWNMAVEFCEALSKLDDVPVEAGYRLPTDAEFGFAQQAGTDSRFWYGDEADEAGMFEVSMSNSPRLPRPVASLRANAFGLYDMAGNVCEFCSDWWTQDEYKQFADLCAVNPTGPADGAAGGHQKVVRGASMDNPPEAHRSARRVRSDPSLWVNTLGFRAAIPCRTVAMKLNRSADAHK